MRHSQRDAGRNLPQAWRQTIRQCFSHPGVQEAARIGFIGAATDMLQPPFKWIHAPVVVGGPPGMFVMANLLFQPGHNP
jgi:hypothetical protein